MPNQVKVWRPGLRGRTGVAKGYIDTRLVATTVGYVGKS